MIATDGGGDRSHGGRWFESFQDTDDRSVVYVSEEAADLLEAIGLMESRRDWLLFLGSMVAVAFNLRIALISVAPVLERITADLGLSYAAASLLTTIPTLCFGIFAFASPTLARLLGRARGVFYAAVLLAFATGMRFASDVVVVLFASAVLAGIAIAVCQTFLPALVSQQAPERAASTTGLYTASMVGGAALAAGTTAPLASRLGDWTAALGIWVLPAAFGALAWIPTYRRLDTGATTVERDSLPWRDPTALLAVAFFAGLAILFFAITTWLPPFYVAHGLSAAQGGFVLMSFLVGMIGGTLLITVVGDRTVDRRPWYLGAMVLTLGSLAVVTFEPLFAPFELAFAMGVGIGALFTLAMTLPVDLAVDTDAAGRLTSLLFGVGFTVGAIGPFAVGGLRDLLGSFTLAFAGLVATATFMTVIATRFGPTRYGTVE